MRKTFLAISVSFTLGACTDNASLSGNSGTETTVQTIKVDVPREPIVENMANLFSEYTHVKLQTPEDFEIGTIDKVEIVNDTMYVVADKNTRPQILVFDICGQFVRAIGKQGKGPFEYTILTDMSASESTISALDLPSRRLIVYGHGGEKIMEQKLPFLAMEIAEISQETYAFSGALTGNEEASGVRDFSLWTWDSKNQNVIRRAVAHECDKYANMVSTNALRRANGNVYFCDMVANDTVFRISPNGEIDAEYCFDLGNAKDYKYMRELSVFDVSQATKEGKTTCVSCYAILDSTVYCRISSKPNSTHVFSNLKRQTQKMACKTKSIAKENLCFGIGDVLTSYKGQLVWTANAYDYAYLATTAQQDKDFWNSVPAELAERNKAFLASISEEDNPVLVFARPKE